MSLEKVPALRRDHWYKLPPRAPQRLPPWTHGPVHDPRGPALPTSRSRRRQIRWLESDAWAGCGKGRRPGRPPGEHSAHPGSCSFIAQMPSQDPPPPRAGPTGRAALAEYLADCPGGPLAVTLSGRPGTHLARRWGGARRARYIYVPTMPPHAHQLRTAPSAHPFHRQARSRKPAATFMEESGGATTAVDVRRGSPDRSRFHPASTRPSLLRPAHLAHPGFGALPTIYSCATHATAW